MSNIVLYGGSFNPIHDGHIEIAKSAKRRARAEKVIFIPAKNPRWKEPLNNDKDRFEMIKLAISLYKYFEVSSIELDAQDGGEYTIDTIKRILDEDKKKGVENTYYYIIGNDQLKKLHLWHDIDELSTLVHFMCFPRTRYRSKQEIVNEKKYGVKYCNDFKRIEISSTKIRKMTSFDVSYSVLYYMASHHLYKYDEIYQMLGEERYLHSVSVADWSYNVAAYNLIDKEHCYNMFIAGLLHDIGKNVDDLETIEKALKMYPAGKNVPDYALHQFVGAYLAKTHFKIDDKLILDAIAYHCTGKKYMTKYDKILFVCDKADPLRGYPSQKYIRAIRHEIKSGFVKFLKANKKYLETKRKDKETNYLTEECYATYLNENDIDELIYQELLNDILPNYVSEPIKENNCLHFKFNRDIENYFIFNIHVEDQYVLKKLVSHLKTYFKSKGSTSLYTEDYFRRMYAVSNYEIYIKILYDYKIEDVFSYIFGLE